MRNIFKHKGVVQALKQVKDYPKKSIPALVLAGALICTPASAAQTGAIKGIVSAGSKVVSGVTVTASSNIMPKSRTVTTRDDGSYNLALLLPGKYELKFTDKSGSSKILIVDVLLEQTSKVNFTIQDNQDSNVLTITGTAIVREGDSGISTSLGEDVIKGVPIGQNYRDLLKLIPGVAYSELGTLGPNAGGSGRDNKYGFDGVDVSLPMFGNLSSEPSTHDMQSVSIDRGAAKAVGFNRSGGFAINTISKSGTNELHGNLEYKLQDKGFVSDKDDADNTKYTLDKSWLTASISGPLIDDTLFFYGSYYRPETNRVNKATAYGPAKDFQSIKDEYFGKFTYAPTEEFLLNVSLRSSENVGKGLSVGGLDADSTSQGSVNKEEIFTLDGSYILSDYTSFSFKYGKFDFETRGAPDWLLTSVNPTVGDSLDLNNLDQLGAFNVPTLSSDGSYDNVVAQALIDQYGYIDENGNRAGGGQIGAGSTINDQDFYRDSVELNFDHEMEIAGATNRFHIGIKHTKGTEVLSRTSNGWGSLSYIGGEETASDGTPIYYRTITQQMSLQDANGAVIPGITSSSESYNFEINDTIESGELTYNLGVLISHDVLYGQGLKERSSTASGYILAPGNTYKMKSINWKDLIQPRLGISWNYSGVDTVYANFASYNPEASSLARAASWARNTRSALDVDFDQNGEYIESEPRDGSSGKFFQAGIKPRRIDELTLGSAMQITEKLFVKAHLRRREGAHFWEDTWNNSRDYGTYGPWGGVPEHLRDAGPYIPELPTYRAEVGGSSYVIAELDDAYTSYNEFSIEADWKGDRTYLNISYTWSHYYGNFDQDSVSGNADANLFIGSSSLADGRGRQIWDGKEGKLFGDKPHVLKAFGYYTTDWNANIGGFFVYQSGDVWEPWDGTPYGYNSSTIRNVDSAGSRRSPSHWQFDLNYTQDVSITDDYKVQFRADLFNVFDNQTGYRIDPYVDNATFGQPRSLYAPRRLQLSANFVF